MVIKLKPDEFTERLEPIFRSVESRLPEHLRHRKAEYFFPEWRRLMSLGFAHTWEIPDAVLGCLITPDIFSGTPVGLVPFWFSLPGTPGTGKLLRRAELEARELGCARLSIASYDLLDGERIAAIYQGMRYLRTEQIFQKELV
jgi:hypothetical protein